MPTSITFDNDGSEIYTIIEVDTRDRPGLLYDLTRTLANNHVYIASAVIATYGEQVVDTFYVKDMFGLKFVSDAKQKSLEKKLRDAIEKGAITGTGMSALKRPVQPMPGDIAALLDASGLRAAYDARPPYQRNDWLAWIARAKQPATRQRRIDSMIADLDRGHGYMGIDWQPRA